MADHDKLKGQAKKAIGIAYTNDNLITIDNFFVEECYKYFELNDIMSTWELGSHYTLEYVICHEIAHFSEARHGKKHTELTNRLLNKVELPQKYYEYIERNIIG
jgi:hypothetical protein